MRTDPGSLSPGTRRNLIPGGGIPGSVLILEHVTPFWKNTLNLYYYIFSIWTSFELSRPVVVQHPRPVVVQHLVTCPFAQIGLPIVSHVSPETAGWIFSVRSSIELSRLVAVQHLAHLSSWPIWACLWARAPLWTGCLSSHLLRGWGVLSFSERLVCKSCWVWSRTCTC